MRVTERLYVLYNRESGLYLKTDAPKIFTDKLSDAVMWESRVEADAAAENLELNVLALSVEHADVSGGKKETIPGYDQMNLFGES